MCPTPCCPGDGLFTHGTLASHTGAATAAGPAHPGRLQLHSPASQQTCRQPHPASLTLVSAAAAPPCAGHAAWRVLGDVGLRALMRH